MTAPSQNSTHTHTPLTHIHTHHTHTYTNRKRKVAQRTVGSGTMLGTRTTGKCVRACV